MTPLHLDILMHYYTRGGDYDQLETNRARWEYAFDLARLGLLYTPDLVDGERFAITVHGKRIFKKIIQHFNEQI